MLQQVLGQLGEMVGEGDRILVAVSGGMDSMTLLNVLVGCSGLGFTLAVGHVNHGIREASTAEEAFVRQACDVLGVPCFVDHVDAPALAAEQHLSLEDAARRLRRAALISMADRAGANRIALAHHLEDQAETLLLHLVRGAGPRGLRGMAAMDLPIIRPLLTVSRGDIESFAIVNGIAYCQDASNADLHYARNRLRHQVMPQLRQINPGLDETLARTARLMGEEETWLNALAVQQLDKLADLDAAALRLDVARLNGLALPLRRRVVRAALEATFGLTDVSFERLEALLFLVAGQGTGGRIQIGGGRQAFMEYGKLCLGREVQNTAWQQFLSPGGIISVQEAQGVIWVDREAPEGVEERWVRLIQRHLLDGAVIRNRRPGDRVNLPNCGNKKLSDIFIDRKVPRRLRENWPIVAVGNRVLWVIGICGEAKPISGDMVSLVWQQQNAMRTEQAAPQIIDDGAMKRDLGGDTAMDDSIERVLVTQEQLRVRINELGQQITRDYQGTDSLLAVGILKGAVVYYADLVRQINLPVSMDFMSVSSYGSGTTSSGVVRINKDLDKDPVGKDILIVEDIIDSGLTLNYLKELLLDRKPRSLRICCLLDKPSRRKANITADYIGFSIPDEFVVGFGLDYNEYFRNLPDICVLSPKVYRGE